jgi:hypothetical protein
MLRYVDDARTKQPLAEGESESKSTRALLVFRFDGNALTFQAEQISERPERRFVVEALAEALVYIGRHEPRFRFVRFTVLPE